MPKCVALYCKSGHDSRAVLLEVSVPIFDELTGFPPERGVKWTSATKRLCFMAEFLDWKRHLLAAVAELESRQIHFPPSFFFTLVSNGNLLLPGPLRRVGL